MVEDMYALEKWLEDELLEAHCKGEWEKVGVYSKVLSKIKSAKVNLWEHIPRDCNYVW